SLLPLTCRGRAALTARRRKLPAVLEDLPELVQIQRVSGSKRSALRRNLLSRVIRFAERRTSPSRRRIRARILVGAPLNQELNRGSVAFIGCPHQWSRAAQCLFCIWIGAAIEQDFDRVEIARARGSHQRRSSQRQ